MSVWVFASQPNSLQIFRCTRYLQALNGRNSVIMNPNKSRMYPVRCVLAGQVGSLEPSLLVEKICSITLREQLTRSIIWRFGGCTKNYSKKKQHKNRGSRAIIGRKGAGEKSIRIHREIEREKTSHLSPKLFKWDSNQEGMKGDPKEGCFFFSWRMSVVKPSVVLQYLQWDIFLCRFFYLLGSHVLVFLAKFKQAGAEGGVTFEGIFLP